MTNTAPVSTRWRLRTFVAWSIFVHLGAGVAWGIPALITRQAEQERVQAEAANAKHLQLEEVKAREHARPQQIDATRREVDRELRKEFDKLAAAISEAKREELWKQVTKRIAPESANLAEALGTSTTPEQDLRTLEAELHRAMIKSLDDIVTATSARELADRFVDQVESHVAPGLAETMKDELAKSVTPQMRAEADQLIAKQRDDAKRAAEQATSALNEAAAKISSATEADNEASAHLAKTDTTAHNSVEAGKQLEQAKAQLSEAAAKFSMAAPKFGEAAPKFGEAAPKFGEASPKAANLDSQAQAQVSASDKAIAAASAATEKAILAVQSKSPEAAAAVAAAQASTAAAQTVTKKAIEAVANQADRGMAASADIRAAVESTLSAQVERSLTDELTQNTLPRLAAKLQDGFKKQLDANGLRDDALVAQVGKEVQARLAKSVPAMAKASNAAVDAKFSDLPASDVSTTAAKKTGDSLLDKALAEGLAGMSANATKRIGEVTANPNRDGTLVDKAIQGLNDSTSNPSASSGEAGATKSPHAAADVAAIAELRDSVGALARSLGNGRVSTNATFAANISVLRQAALARGRGMQHDDAAYEKVTGQIAGRTAVNGEKWSRQGATGDASQSVENTGVHPAQVVGRALTEATPSLTNNQAYVPNFKTLAFATLPYCTTDFRIDGKLAKWDALPALNLKSEHGSDPSKQVMKLAWSNAGLFIYCKIADPNHHLDKAEQANFWESDSLELWIDAFNSKEKYRTRHIGQQFWLWPGGSSSDASLTGGEAVSLGKGGGFRYVSMHTDQLERWSAPTPEGWVMEARIPPALITDADLAAGRILGFNAYVNTMGGTDWYWSAGDTVSTSVQPDTWGDLLLAGSDAHIEVLAGKTGLVDKADTADKAKVVLPVGEPLRLRVTDPDMDLNPAAHDKVMVTIQDGHGGQQIAVLEETSTSSGIFEGAVTTALALDQPVPAVLSVYEGGRVHITYVDQSRANGAREAQLSTSVTFGSAVLAAAGP